MASIKKNKNITIFAGILAIIVIALLGYKLRVVFFGSGDEDSGRTFESKNDMCSFTGQSYLQTIKKLHNGTISNDMWKNAIAVETQMYSLCQTDITVITPSVQPRIETLTYQVTQTDTLSSLATKFSISPQTIQWANTMTTKNITPGEKVLIPPVNGVAHKVLSGETVNSLAVRYHSTAQKIIDFPGNKFANPQINSLIIGNILMIPDGHM